MDYLKIGIIVLVAVTFIYLSQSTFNQFKSQEEITPVLSHVSFKYGGVRILTGDIPDFDPLKNDFVRHKDNYILWRTIAIIFSWIAFIVATVITVISGFFGQVVPDTADNVEKLINVLKKKKRKVTLITILAAIGTVSTGVNVKAKEYADEEKSIAMKASEELLTAEQDYNKATTDFERHLIIERIKLIIH